MVDQFSMASLLATATCVALFGLGIGTACDKDVRTEESSQGAPGPTHVDDPTSPGAEPNAVGGGPEEVSEPVGDTGRRTNIDEKVDEQDEDDEQVDDAVPDIDAPLSPGTDQPGTDQPGTDQPGTDQNPTDDTQEPVEDQGPSGSNREDEATSPNGDGTGEEDAPTEDNWRAPVRGSGGDNPPDFIVPSDPKHV